MKKNQEPKRSLDAFDSSTWNICNQDGRHIVLYSASLADAGIWKDMKWRNILDEQPKVVQLIWLKHLPWPGWLRTYTNIIEGFKLTELRENNM